MNFQAAYYKDPYVQSFHALVTDCIPHPEKKGYYWISLDLSYFYPEGGGQPGDTGFLIPEQSGSSDDSSAYANRVPVLDTQLIDGACRHLTASALLPGTGITGYLDFVHRLDRMQEHTAEHIISGLANKRFGCENVGFHMSDVVTVDFNQMISYEELLTIEQEANAVIRQNLPVHTLLPSPKEAESIFYRRKKELEGDIRIVQIPGADSCACCGLHVKHTGEIGLVKITGYMKYKGGIRFTMLAGRKAYEDYAKKHELLQEISRALSVRIPDAAAGVSSLLGASTEKDKKIAEINSRYFEAAAKNYTKPAGFICRFEDGLNQIELRRFCDTLLLSAPVKTAAVLTEISENHFFFCIASSEINLREALKSLNPLLNGKGGGKIDCVQGSFCAEKKQIADVLTHTFESDIS